MWNLTNIDVTKMCEAFSILNREELFTDENVNVVYDKWFQSFHQVLENHVPHRTVVIRPRDKPWMNSLIRKSIRKRDRLLKLNSRYKTVSTWERYKQQRNLTTSLIRSRKMEYYKNLNLKLQDPNLGSKKWWGLVKSIYGGKIQVTVPTLREGCNMITDAKEKAQLLNEYFGTQCTLDNADTDPQELSNNLNLRSISHIFTTNKEVNYLLKNVDISKACGVDGVGNNLIRLSADGISGSFSRFINLSLSSGVFPDAWKFANVTSIFKKDDRQLIKENCRPVSLLPSLSKINERIVFIPLYNFLLDIKFLSPFQSGFRPGDSTVNQLIYIVHRIYEALDSGNEVRMVFLDISKAFDKVWHKGLIPKLKYLGVREPLLDWIISYLSERKQRV